MAQQYTKNLLQNGIKLHKSGDLDSAKKAYDKIIKIDPENFDALHLLGLIFYQQKNHGLAILFFEKAILLNSNFAPAHNNLALALQASNKLNEAIISYQRSLSLNPNSSETSNNFGVCLLDLRLYDEAESAFNKALSLNPQYAEAYVNLGNVYKDSKKPNKAISAYNQAIIIDPNLSEAFCNRGIVLHELGLYSDSLESFNKAISLNPNYKEAYNNLGNLLLTLKQYESANHNYESAIKLDSNYGEAYSNRANALIGLKRSEEAISSCNMAIAINPNDAQAYNNLGNAFKSLNLLSDAIESFEKAIKLEPNLAMPYSNLGVTLKELNRIEDAAACYNRALIINPELAEAHSNLGIIHQENLQIADAINSYDLAIAICPENPAPYWNKSIALLLNGQYEEGWKLYEMGWENKMRGTERTYDSPTWRGDGSLKDKTILVHCEQGLGDSIQFSRYIKLVKELGATVIFEVPSPLVKLFNKLEGVDVLLAEGDELPLFDYHAPLLSLPLAFKTTISNIPSPGKYIYADNEKIVVWKNKLFNNSKPNVGLVWNGGFRMNQPELWATNNRRNIDLSTFSNYFQDSNFNFYSLQKGNPAESELLGQEQKYWPNCNFFNFTKDFFDFSDTAAFIHNLDLVISVDTSTAHLAAAMGKPTWILNRYDTCWRWLLNRNDSPWYDSVTLFRQDKLRSWEPVLNRVQSELHLKFKT